MSKTFKQSGDYFRQVAAKCSEPLKWEDLWIGIAHEVSNDVTFVNSERSSLTVDLSGTKRHLTDLDGKFDERQTKPDDVCQIPRGANARFAWETLGIKQHSIMLEFSEGLFAVHCPEIISGSFLSGHLTPKDFTPNHQLATLVRLLAREIEEGKNRGQLFAETAIRLLAIEIASTCWTQQPELTKIETAIDHRIKKAIAYIDEHFAENITLKDLVMVSNLNATQLIALFKRHSGYTPYAYVVKRRVQEAILKLRNSKAPISEVALEVGFYDQQQMTHAFKRLMGFTPNSVRT